MIRQDFCRNPYVLLRSDAAQPDQRRGQGNVYFFPCKILPALKHMLSFKVAQQNVVDRQFPVVHLQELRLICPSFRCCNSTHFAVRCVVQIATMKLVGELQARLAGYSAETLSTVLLAALALIGLVAVLRLVFSINNFVWVYFGRPCKNLKKLGEWAVVTGATDGIGKAYAEALAKRGGLTASDHLEMAAAAHVSSGSKRA